MLPEQEQSPLNTYSGSTLESVIGLTVARVGSVVCKTKSGHLEERTAEQTTKGPLLYSFLGRVRVKFLTHQGGADGGDNSYGST
jgi:hypothetical protein